MDERIPRYSFEPLETRGLLFGLQPVQVVLAGAALVMAWMVLRAIPAPWGPSLALTAAIGGSGAAFWSKDGQTVASWSTFALGWAARRLRGPVLSDDPLDGVCDRSRTTSGGRNSLAATCPRGIELIELPARPGETDLGVVVDRIARHWVAVIPARGAAFSLLDPHDQARRLDSWRVVLNSLGRPGSPIRRVQWIERTHLTEGVSPVEPLHASRPSGSSYSPAADSYLDVISGAGRRSETHQVLLAVAVDGPDSPSGHAGRRAAEMIRRELRLLEGQLRHAELLTPGPLAGPALAGVLKIAHTKRASKSSPRTWRSFRPMAEEEGWSVFRTDGVWHATYWIAEWPRIEVGPDFMSPLLMGDGRRAVSLVMAPVPPERASRDARAARTSDAAEEHLRANAGFLPSARRSREAEAATRREEEVADGHAEFRFSGYLTVSAGDRTELDLACAESEHSAQAAHLEIRRLYGRQGEAFTWTLPLARGLRER